MTQLNYNETGLAVGLFIGAFHLVWSVLVALGVGQVLYDFILWAHMIHLPIVIGPFNVTASVTLVLMTFVLGYVFGLAFAYIWNMLHKGNAA